MSLLRWPKGWGWNLPRHRFGALAVVLTVVLLGRAAPVSANLVIVPTFDSSITSDPNAAAIEGVINAAVQEYNQDFSTPAVPAPVTILFSSMNSGLGQSVASLYEGPYLPTLTALQSVAHTPDAINALQTLPATTGNPVNGNANVFITSANLRAIGIDVNGYLGPTGTYDGLIGLNTHLTFPGSPDTQNLVGLKSVVLHEINEVLGFGSAINFNNATPPLFDPTGPVYLEDLFRYAQNGIRSFNTDPNAQAFFSIDGGKTDLAQFNQIRGGDYSDWYSTPPFPPNFKPQVQDAFATLGANPDLGVELRVLNVIGYNLISAVVPEPSSLSLLSVAMLVTGYGWWRRKNRAQPVQA
jgi:hypothetical protein